MVSFKIIPWAKVKDQGEKTNKKIKKNFWICSLFTENLEGHKVLGCIYLTLNLQIPPVADKTLLQWNDLSKEWLLSPTEF